MLAQELEDILARLYCSTGDFSKAIPHSEQHVVLTQLRFGKSSIETAHELIKLEQIAFNAHNVCFAS